MSLTNQIQMPNNWQELRVQLCATEEHGKKQNFNALCALICEQY
jgi:hypothetical protein